MRTLIRLGVVAALAVSVSACAAPRVQNTVVDEPSARPAADLARLQDLERRLKVSPGTVLVLTADDLADGELPLGAQINDDSAGGNDAWVVYPRKAAYSALRVVAGGEGGSVPRFDFPAPCQDDPSAQPCGHPVLEVPNAASLSPGTRDFTAYAMVRMAPTDTTKGSNILQKGFSTGGGGQWKIQVDGTAGLPSCTVVAPSAEGVTDVVNVVKSTRTIADDQWHVVECARQGTAWTISVDGAVTSRTIDAGLDLDIKAPVRIGGKNTKEDADPFHGEVALVALNVGTGGV